MLGFAMAHDTKGGSSVGHMNRRRLSRSSTQVLSHESSTVPHALRRLALHSSAQYSDSVPSHVPPEPAAPADPAEPAVAPPNPEPACCLPAAPPVPTPPVAAPAPPPLDPAP